ncbi:MAG: tripartite tricarboxylate transporter substrate binding protein [Betaproteobacteria bacterium]|jgi:tripartite-type tricarboxylate transporter receptor subunit TctC
MAQTFPSKPIRIVVPFTPGGPNDILARMIGQRYTAVWGQQTLVDNRPGGGTVIGTDIVAKAPADGHTLLMVSTSHAANPSLMPKLPFDTLRDFVSVGQAVSSPNVLVVHPSVPARNTRELLDIAKARPGQITFASGGSGAATHLAGELLKILGGVEMTHIPYKGAGPATIDLISGQVTWMFGTILPTIPHVRAGKLRALAVSGKRRAEVLPEVPTVAEHVPGFEASSWYGVFAPAGTPAEVIIKLNQEMARALTPVEVRQRLAAEGTEVVAGNPEDFMQLFRAEAAKWARVIKQAGIRLE